MAAWMPAVASTAPLPYVLASTVAHTVLRAGTPPGIPGFHFVRRSVGMMSDTVAARDPANELVTAAAVPVARLSGIGPLQPASRRLVTTAA